MHILLQIIEKNPIPTFWKNIDLEFMGCNDAFVKMVSAITRDNFIGKRDVNLPWGNNWAKYKKDDLLVLKTGTPTSTLEEISTSDGKIIRSVTSKYPILDVNKVIGLVGYCKDVTLEQKIKEIETEKEIDKINSKFTRLIEKFVNDARSCRQEIVYERLGWQFPRSVGSSIESLSNRETEILYYLSLHKTPKEISRILSKIHEKEISVKSIQTVLANKLYSKFDAHTPGQLIEKAALLNLIPLHMPK